MQENSQIPVTGLSRPAPKAGADFQSATSAERSTTCNALNGATFDDSCDESYVFSSLRKLQDASKFDKARFSFRLYKK